MTGMATMNAKTLAPEVMQERIREAARVLVSFGATEVYVFGSYARGEATADSDVDLAVRGLPDEVYFRAGAQAEQALPVPVDILTLDEKSEGSAFVRLLFRRGEMRRVA